jgi:DNA topoisomerase VI subunit B
MSRETFATPRAAEFLERRALQSQTGQPAERFGDVVIKELVDNALDAAESAGAAPEVTLQVIPAGGGQQVVVADNGPGLPAEVVARILDFDVLVSDKAAYRSPTRGMQGNAWKTLLGIPGALGAAAPVVIEAHRIRHEITVGLDPGGNVVVKHDRAASDRAAGTRVEVPLPATTSVDAARWTRGFALTNPHATLILQGDSADPESAEIYKPTVGDGWCKPLPSDPTSPHWYDQPALTRLVFAHIAAARAGGRDVPLGEFVRTFEGLSATAKAKAVRAALPEVERLSDFAERPGRIAELLTAMQAAARVPKPTKLGTIGADHIRSRLDLWYGVERFWYSRKRLDHHGVPWVLEVAVAVTERPAEVFYGVNYSPTFGDPLRGTILDAGEISTTGAASFLQRCDAYPTADNGRRRAAVVHVVCPAVEFLDKGKTSLEVPRGR